MYIGIIVYSLSGHTWSLAEALRDRFISEGHAVELKSVTTEGSPNLRDEDVALADVPSIKGYHAIVFASPVRGGVIPSPMLRYLQQLPPMKGTPVVCTATSFFRYDWGRKQVLTHMQELLERKGADVRGTAGMRWFSFRRKQEIKRVGKKIVALFS